MAKCRHKYVIVRSTTGIRRPKGEPDHPGIESKILVHQCTKCNEEQFEIVKS